MRGSHARPGILTLFALTAACSTGRIPTYVAPLVSRGTADQIEILPDIRARGPLPGLPPVISLGLATRSTLLTILGSPDYTKVLADSTVLSYQLPNVTDLIEFYIVRDTVRVLRWRFYMG